MDTDPTRQRLASLIVAALEVGRKMAERDVAGDILRVLGVDVVALDREIRPGIDDKAVE